MIGYPGSHRRSPILVFFVFASYLQSQAQMRLDKVIIGEGEMELLLQTLTLLGKGNGLSDQAAVVMTHGQVVAFDKAGVDVTAHGGLLEFGRNRLLGAKDNARGNVNHPPLFSALDHLRIEQVLGRFEDGFARSSPLAGSRELLLDPVGGQQSIVVVLEFIGGEQREVSIGASLDASHYLVGIGLGMASHHEVDHYFVAWIKADPHPLVSVDGCQSFKGREVRFLFLTNDHSSSNWHSSRW